MGDESLLDDDDDDESLVADVGVMKKVGDVKVEVAASDDD